MGKFKALALLLMFFTLVHLEFSAEEAAAYVETARTIEKVLNEEE